MSHAPIERGGGGSGDPEAARIRDVYGKYRDSGRAEGRWSRANPGNAAILEERQRRVAEALAAVGLPGRKDRRLLEIGCGSGGVLEGLIELGMEPGQLAGVDLLEDRIREARVLLPGVSVQSCDARQLPFEEASFDVVLAFTVFSSILAEDVAAGVAGEAARVLRRGGSILIYDLRFRSPSNRHVRPIRAEHLRRWFPGFRMTRRSLTLLPPLARRLGAWSGALYPWLAGLPILRTHTLTVLTHEH